MIPVLECVRKVYRVESGPCFDILTDWREQHRLVSKQLFDWIESKGAVSFIPGPEDNVINATPITRVIFEGQLPAGWLQRSISLARPLVLATAKLKHAAKTKRRAAAKGGAT